MAQFLRPNSDIAVGDWTPTPLHEQIDEETANDSDLISSANNTSSDECTVGLSSALQPVSGSRTLRYRYRKDDAGGHVVNLVVSLREDGTVIDTWTHNDISDTFTQASQDITATISDWSDLSLSFERTGDTGGPGGNRRSAQVSWAEFEIPEVAVSIEDRDVTSHVGVIYSESGAEGGAFRQVDSHTSTINTEVEASGVGTRESTSHTGPIHSSSEVTGSATVDIYSHAGPIISHATLESDGFREVISYVGDIHTSSERQTPPGFRDVTSYVAPINSSATVFVEASDPYTVYSNHILHDNPIAYWRLGEMDTEDPAKDLAGHPAEVIDTMQGQNLDLDGTSGTYAEIPDVNLFSSAVSVMNFPSFIIQNLSGSSVSQEDTDIWLGPSKVKRLDVHEYPSDNNASYPRIRPHLSSGEFLLPSGTYVTSMMVRVLDNEMDIRIGMLRGSSYQGPLGYTISPEDGWVRITSNPVEFDGTQTTQLMFNPNRSTGRFEVAQAQQEVWSGDFNEWRPSHRFTGDIDIRLKCAIRDIDGGALLGQWKGGSVPARRFNITRRSGTVCLDWANHTTSSMSWTRARIVPPEREINDIRYTIHKDEGEVFGYLNGEMVSTHNTLSYGDPNDVPWSSIGDLDIGSSAAAYNGEQFNFLFEVRDGIDGPIVASSDFTEDGPWEVGDDNTVTRESPEGHEVSLHGNAVVEEEHEITYEEIQYYDGEYVGNPELGVPGAIVGDFDTAVFGPSGFSSGFDVSGIPAMPDTITVEMWFKSDTEIESQHWGVGLRRNDFNNGWGMDARISDNEPTIGVRIDTSAGNNQVRLLPTSWNIWNGMWRHIVLVLDSGTGRWQVDGTNIQDFTYNHGDGFIVQHTFRALLASGADVYMDEVALYDYILSPEQVQRHYEIGSTGKYALDVPDGDDINVQDGDFVLYQYDWAKQSDSGDNN